jgi:pantetheine-phosphate adenylyltransferase
MSESEEVARVYRVACPGSFDPVTNGHLDIIGRASGLYDEVVVAVGVNVSKNRLFTDDERVAMLREVTSKYGNVRIERFQGLLVDFCAAHGITAVIKGLRAVSDFEYEMQMAQMNYRMANVETLFMTTNPLYSFLRSSLVKEVAAYGGDVSGLVPDTVLVRLRERLESRLCRAGCCRWVSSDGGGPRPVCGNARFCLLIDPAVHRTAST